ncbi:hypothetical protein CEXT_15771 [Caerostris extrusa]|uniref:Uncharacterized protein n=1 Tax=Caerostris extrusa TaxID=172846 RepID=A0AAV4RBE1_CAEEX|nr:hypothetical protein CEXT_15771 [Caerostris extrusa]
MKRIKLEALIIVRTLSSNEKGSSILSLNAMKTNTNKVFKKSGALLRVRPRSTLSRRQLGLRSCVNGKPDERRSFTHAGRVHFYGWVSTLLDADLKVLLQM